MEPPTRNYDKEIAAQIAITEETKERHTEAMAELGKLHEQATKREAELKGFLDERTAQGDHDTNSYHLGNKGTSRRSYG